eukprot:TRINITY_DN4898_c0_g1_i1.p1 TRINITY_DN4898_c0_g1~~TRINITY_DN4898_c0_g1_i1.p1  ORF type:complete len:218 (-),score=52.73 TRINITY_DN4898_c0_g1_i1:290-943(-)
MGIIVDTFSSLREKKEQYEYTMKNNCFICDLEVGEKTLDMKRFNQHREVDHNMWNYLFFYFHLHVKGQYELNAYEDYVFEAIKAKEFTFFPYKHIVDKTSKDGGGKNKEMMSRPDDGQSNSDGNSDGDGEQSSSEDEEENHGNDIKGILADGKKANFYMMKMMLSRMERMEDVLIGLTKRLGYGDLLRDKEGELPTDDSQFTTTERRDNFSKEQEIQ